LEKWIQTLSVANIDDAAALQQHFEGTHAESNQHVKEKLNGHQNRHGPRHHVAKLAAVLEDDDC
jgi:hypothetical protein